MSDLDEVVGRVKRRAFGIAAAGILVGFVLGTGPGASLTIAAAVVISSFLVLEKATERIASRAARARWRTLVPLFLVAVGSFALLGLVLWRWKGFDPVAGAVGLSIVVLAVIPEIWMGR